MAADPAGNRRGGYADGLQRRRKQQHGDCSRGGKEGYRGRARGQRKRADRHLRLPVERPGCPDPERGGREEYLLPGIFLQERQRAGLQRHEDHERPVRPDQRPGELGERFRIRVLPAEEPDLRQRGQPAGRDLPRGHGRRRNHQVRQAQGAGADQRLPRLYAESGRTSRTSC